MPEYAKNDLPTEKSELPKQPNFFSSSPDDSPKPVKKSVQELLAELKIQAAKVAAAKQILDQAVTKQEGIHGMFDKQNTLAAQEYKAATEQAVSKAFPN